MVRYILHSVAVFEHINKKIGANRDPCSIFPLSFQRESFPSFNREKIIRVTESNANIFFAEGFKTSCILSIGF